MAKSKPTLGSADHDTALSKHEADIAKRRTLFVRSLDYSVTSETLSEKFSFVAPIKHATVVINPSSKESRGFGFVTFADAEDALRAIQQLDGAEFLGRKMKVELAEPRRRKDGSAAATENKAPLPVASDRPKKQEEEGKRRSPRLIIRNLPWSIQKPEQLLELFQPYGKVKDIIIPKKRTGEMSGFAFVTMKGYKNAERAIEKTNGIEIEGRTVAVDWAVEKEEWQKLNPSGKGAEPQEEVAEEEDEVEEEDEEMDDDEQEGSDEEMDNEEDGDDEDDEDEDEDEDRPPTDSTTTLFIRNLPYSATDDKVYQHFTQFGPVHYARIVMDHATARPKGTGFICFYDPEITSECLRSAPRITSSDNKPSLLQSEALDPDGKYTLDGRILSLSRAVDRNQAEKLSTSAAHNREKTNNDKRRLYLLNEGMIPASSAAWARLSPSERLLRDSSRDQRRKLLQADPNLHLSLTRLSIRNLPRWVTHKDLKQIARKAIPGFAEDMAAGRRAPLSKEELSRDSEGKAAEEARRAKGLGVVKQAKVQLEKVGGRSRGYGFVEYWSHRYALMGLRFMNGQLIPGSPPADDEDGAPRRKLPGAPIEPEKKKRLIVEFAIENAKVVNRRKENEVRSRQAGEKQKEDALKPPAAITTDAGRGKSGKGSKGGSKRKRDEGEAVNLRELKKRKSWNQKTVKGAAAAGDERPQKGKGKLANAPKPQTAPPPKTTAEKTQEIIRAKRIQRKMKARK